VIPNALDLRVYPFRHRSSAMPRLLWMRTFHDIYNPLMALDILAQVQRVYPQATLTMAGQEKGLLDSIKECSRARGLDNNITFSGFLDQAGKQKIFATHDIFLNTSRVDNMPVSVIEACAFGLPVVATAVGGLPDMITNGKNGLLVADEDANGMSQAVLRLLFEPSLTASISHEARHWAEQFDWSQLLPLWEELFAAIMES
jgi:L-malate glycosyltransferase